MKSGKYMGLNVANIKSHKTFEDDTVRLAVEEGFEHTDTYKLQLSSQESGAKYEPSVYIQKTLKSLDTIYRGIVVIALQGPPDPPKNYDLRVIITIY